MTFLERILFFPAPSLPATTTTTASDGLLCNTLYAYPTVPHPWHSHE